jgi:transcriptional regulator with XRE-family HTH domain
MRVQRGFPLQRCSGQAFDPARPRPYPRIMGTRDVKNFRQRLRVAAGSQRALAKSVGIAVRRAASWERGRGRLRAEEVEGVARALRAALWRAGLDVSLAELFALLWNGGPSPARGFAAVANSPLCGVDGAC